MHKQQTNHLTHPHRLLAVWTCSQRRGKAPRRGKGIDSLSQLAFRFVPRASEYPLPRFFIFDDVFARPELAKFSYTCLCIVKRMHCLYELQGSIALHREEAEW